MTPRKGASTAWSLALGISGLVGCKHPVTAPAYQLQPVATRDIVVSVNANGSVQPKDSVEIKSKASGEIIRISVQTGDEVKKGKQLVLVDQRIPKSTLEQARADLDVAKAQDLNAQSQLKRADALYQSKSITDQDWETAKLGAATSKAAVVRAQTNLDNAKISFEDTDVRAPSDGVILSKNVDIGTVIASATGTVGGGTVLLKMANLDTVQVRAMVDETDIGKLQPGLDVSITVDAYPNRAFGGQVLKIEPQSVVQQNVTMFPVMITLPNPDHLLRPGMNTEIAITVGQRRGVLTIPNAALRTQRDVASAAGVIGIPMDQVQKQLAASAPAGAPDGQATMGARLRGADTAKNATPAGAGGEKYTTNDGREVTLPPGIKAKQVDDIMAKMRSGGGFQSLSDADRAIMQQLRASGVLGRRGGGGGGGQGGFGAAGGGAVGGDQAGGDPGRRSRRNSFQFGGNFIVFVMRNSQPTAVNVRTGLTDLDNSEVISGITAKDTVLLLPSASLVASQDQFKQMLQRNTAIPGIGGTVPGGGGRPGGGGPGR